MAANYEIVEQTLRNGTKTINTRLRQRQRILIINNKMSKLKEVMQKYSPLSDYYGILTKYPEGEWFDPTNKDSEDYSVCSYLQKWHLIEKRTEPIWSEDSFKGQRIFFRYKNDLKYGQ